jgi:GTP cyclohydrolase III
MVIAITLDGYKVSNATGTGTGTINAGATGNVSVTLSSAELVNINHVLGIKQVSVTGGTVLIAGFDASGNTVTVTLYNPGASSASVTVTVTASVVGN